jgi:hypothetical protein
MLQGAAKVIVGRRTNVPPPLLVTSRLGEHPLLPTYPVHSQRRPSVGDAHVQLFISGYATSKLTASTAECMPAHVNH